jgi:hypothetical protein
VRPVTVIPPIERTAPVAYPVIPEGEAVCDGAPCLSDAETGTLLADFAGQLDEANARLTWLRNWFAGLE